MVGNFAFPDPRKRKCLVFQSILMVLVSFLRGCISYVSVAVIKPMTKVACRRECLFELLVSEG